MFMRQRNVKNKEEIINNSVYVIHDAEKQKGNWYKIFQNNNPIYIVGLPCSFKETVNMEEAFKFYKEESW